MYRNILFFICFSVNLYCEDTLFTQRVINSIRSNAIDELNQSFSGEFYREVIMLRPPFSKTQTAVLLKKFKQYDFVKFMDSYNSPEYFGLFSWLARHPDQRDQLVQNITPEDDGKKVLDAILLMMEEDRMEAKNNREYKLTEEQMLINFKIMTAIALVWDKPEKLIHNQMGPKPPLYGEMNLYSLFQHFHKVYTHHYHLVDLKDLDISELVYVVHTPVSEDELKSGLRLSRGSSSSWGKNYGRIAYDHDRIAVGEYSWPDRNEDYSLYNIAEFGGICVDQAYYALMIGRICGLPTIYFSGHGRRGGHAWMGHYRKKGQWVLDVGKYDNDNYLTGFAKNPQTNRLMTDHELEFSLEKKFRRATFVLSKLYLRAAKFIHSRNSYPDMVKKYTELSIKKEPMNLAAWEFKETLLEPFYLNLPETLDETSYLKVISESLMDGTMQEFYEDKRRAFRKYQDIVMSVDMTVMALLNRCAAADNADEKLKKVSEKFWDKLIHETKKDRIDLHLELAFKKFEYLVAADNVTDACDFFEKILLDCRDEQSLIFEYIIKYLKVADEQDRQPRSAKFMSKMYTKMMRVVDEFSAEMYQLMELAQTAYENSDDSRSLMKLRKEREKYLERHEKLREKIKKEREREDRRGRR